jgi:glutamate synthase domain-containing protein 3
MNSRNRKYALLLIAAIAITATSAMTQAFAQSVDDGMDGYVKGTSGIYTGNTLNAGMMMAKETCCHAGSIQVILHGY